MTGLTPSTRRRLKQLRQVPNVWEGDRRPLVPEFASTFDTDSDPQGECILWVDGVEEVVRAMDVVPPEAGHEAIVRTLLRAMENPHGSNARPARPQKILVRDREIQFFLRGVLQGLDIAVDYVSELPLIEDIFQGLQDVANNRPPHLPPEQAEALLAAASDIWQDAPWELLDEEKILAVELSYGDLGTLYVSILGMLGMEFGILMYRSLDSLKQFRQRVLSADDASSDLERAFLEQDCFFVTFDQLDELLNSNGSSAGAESMQPTFGNLHPLEGMRPVLYEEEAIAVLLALEALHDFFEQHLEALDAEVFPAVQSQYTFPDPRHPHKQVPITVTTLPEVAAELYEMAIDDNLGDDLDEDELEIDLLPVLRYDLIPDNALCKLDALPREGLESLRHSVKYHQPFDTEIPTKAEQYPIILIQTSRPKALLLIEELQKTGGLEAICFNPGEDPFAEERYDLCLLKTQNGDLHLSGEFSEDDPAHAAARRRWDQLCKKTKGQCGLVVAMGATGSSRGNPGLKNMLALFEGRSLSAKELGLGLLELVNPLDEF